MLWALPGPQQTIHGAAKYIVSAGAVKVVTHRYLDAYGSGGSWSNFEGASYDGGLFMYTGRFIDQLTGLQWHLHRWYDPALGRWLSEDSIGFAGDPWNLYRYVGNSPTNGTDPHGLEQIDITAQVRGLTNGIIGPLMVQSTDGKIRGVLWIDASTTLKLPSNAHVEGMPVLSTASYVGGWMVLGDVERGKNPSCGRRVWASLKYYEEAHMNGQLVGTTPLKKWVPDIFDGGKYHTDWEHGGTPFKDFPGLAVPRGLSSSDTITVRRSYYVMIFGLSNNDRTKVLNTPLASMMLQIEITVRGNNVHVSFEENKSHAPPPGNWAQILGLTPVKALPQ